MRKIELLTTIASPSGTHAAGSVITTDDLRAKQLVEARAAKYVDLAPVIPKDEKADAPPAKENAAAGPSKRKVKKKKAAKRKS